MKQLQRAEALLRSNAPSEALKICERLLCAHPTDATALRLAGIAAYMSGDDRRAIAFLSKCTERAPRDVSGWLNLGNALQRLGRLAEALGAFDRVVALEPRLAPGHFNRGNALHATGRSTEAAAAFAQAVAINPAFAKGHLNLGLALKDAGHIEQAEEAYRTALALQPDLAQAHTNLGVALLLGGKTEDALAAHRRAIALAPTFAPAHTNLGASLFAAGHVVDAAAAHRQAIALDANLADAHYNLGCAVSELGQADQAIAAFQRAAGLAPNFIDAHFNLAFELLRQGDLDNGWSEYEWRRPSSDRAGPSWTASRWKGESLDGRTILLHAEQGLGDTLQFVRYADAVAERGGRVVLEAQPCLRRLLRSFSDRVEIIGRGDPLPHFDVHCPLLSLPGIFRTSLATIPTGAPYLLAERDLVELWRERLPKDGFLVGINWQGNPTAAVEQGRSVPLRHFAPLAAIPGIRLISLQKYHGLEQLGDRPAGMKVEVLSPEFDRGPDAFIDTAAIMANLDLVISSDTSAAHLAGALGRPVWVLLRHLPEWRWLLGREDSPWYPTAKLFRQTEPGDWEGMMARVAVELQRLTD